LYLTNSINDFKCQMVEQTATAKFKVPETIKAGRWALMVHTKKGQLLEEPVTRRAADPYHRERMALVLHLGLREYTNFTYTVSQSEAANS
jgi:hypothetical protein